ncbi:hypothetical protein AK830_g12687 [Neonectria ditissima]|uniref:Uncharacterized protein n=1 Tax=Neonectria ditissima TaxID=78410 RepID=A0A0P7B2Y3_9HYPO|nr:hypothetical protein AK830_g12687 [Neonectria ditissima]
MSPCCCRCLDAAAHWYPGKTVRTKGGNAVMEAPTSCAPVSSSASSKCACCVKNGKPCELGLPETKAEYQDLALKFGDKNARARTAAADAAATAARTASEVVARVQLLELTQLQVQLDIANALRNIAENLGRGVSGAASLPLRVGPDSVPWDLDLAVDDDEEE